MQLEQMHAASANVRVENASTTRGSRTTSGRTPSAASSSRNKWKKPMQQVVAEPQGRKPNAAGGSRTTSGRASSAAGGSRTTWKSAQCSRW